MPPLSSMLRPAASRPNQPGRRRTQLHLSRSCGDDQSGSSWAVCKLESQPHSTKASALAVTAFAATPTRRLAIAYRSHQAGSGWQTHRGVHARRACAGNQHASTATKVSSDGTRTKVAASREPDQEQHRLHIARANERGTQTHHHADRHQPHAFAQGVSDDETPTRSVSPCRGSPWCCSLGVDLSPGRRSARGQVNARPLLTYPGAKE